MDEAVGLSSMLVARDAGGRLGRWFPALPSASSAVVSDCDRLREKTVRHTTSGAWQGRLTAASAGRVWEVSVPLRRSLSRRLLSVPAELINEGTPWPVGPVGREAAVSSVPVEHFQDLPRGMEEHHHLWGWARRIPAGIRVCSTQDWEHLRRGDLVLVSVGGGQYHLKVLTKRPGVFRYMVGLD